MDVVFNAVAAEILIQQMNIYCTEIFNGTKNLLAISENNGEWNDNQMLAFQNNMKVIAGDLGTALSLESEYMRTFNQRVNDLRG